MQRPFNLMVKLLSLFAVEHNFHFVMLPVVFVSIFNEEAGFLCIGSV